MQAEGKKKRPIYLVSILLGFIALILAGCGHDQLAKGISRHAHAAQRAQEQHISYVRDAETIRLQSTGEALSEMGSVFSVGCLACMITAAVRKEPGFYSIPLMLFLFSVLWQLILIG